MKRIIDFIKSWFEYPKVSKWTDEHFSSDYPRFTRFQYAVFHYGWQKAIEQRKKDEELYGFKEWNYVYPEDATVKGKRKTRK